MSANCFTADLQWSESCHSQDWWTPYYHKAFPTLTEIQAVPGPSAAQRAGIDKFVILSGGKRIMVDEKARRDRKPVDIVLEVEHVPVDGGKTWPGWIAKPNQFTDYLAMGFAAYRTVFFFPFLQLQAAWLQHADDWIAQYGLKGSPNPRDNPRYHTYCVYVPTEVIMGHLLCAMRIKLSPGTQ